MTNQVMQKNNQDNRNRAVCLYRVSTERQVDEKDDIPMQRTECRKFADRMGWEVVDEKYEKGVSGYKVSANDRDEIQTLKQEALEGKFDILLVYMFDRLGRREDETPFVVQWFVSQGIAVWSRQEGEQKFDSHVDKLTNYIRFWQASGESEKTSLRTKSGLAQAVLEGHYKGGCRAYGYDLVKLGRTNKRGHEVYDLQINPYEAGIVNYMFELYVKQGLGTYRIAKHLTEQKIPSVSGGIWNPATVQKMLKNPLYKGILRSGQTFSQPFDELRIISDHLFDKAQELSDARKRGPERLVPMGVASGTLCSGNIFCGHCGSRLVATTTGKSYIKKDGTRVPKRVAYRCYGARQGKSCNGPQSYSSKPVDEVVENAVRVVLTKLNLSPENDIMNKILLKKQFNAAGQLQKTKEQLEKARQVVAAMQEELVKSIMGASKFSQEDINNLLQQNKEQVAVLQAQLDALSSNSDNNFKELDRLGIKLDQFKSAAEIFGSTEGPSKKMIVSSMIEKVTVRKDYEIEILLNSDLQELLLHEQPAGIPETITVVA